MINYTEVFLETEKEKDLRIWMSKPSSGMLMKLIKSKVAKHQAQSLAAAVKEKDVPDNTEQKSLKIHQIKEGHIKEAQRYQVFLEIWEELNRQDAPFTMTRLSC